MVTIGYPDEQPKSPHRYREEDIVFIEQWGKGLENREIVMGNYHIILSKLIASGKESTQKMSERLKRLFQKSK